MAFAPVSTDLANSPVEFAETSSTVLFFRPGDRCAYTPSIHQRGRDARFP
jgi:hypothetical protein